MSYDYRDEIKSDTMNKITEMLGGMITSTEKIDGKEYIVSEYPFDAYDKSDCIVIYFKNETDYHKILDYYQSEKFYRTIGSMKMYVGRLQYYYDKHLSMVFDCTSY